MVGAKLGDNDGLVLGFLDGRCDGIKVGVELGIIERVNEGTLDGN